MKKRSKNPLNDYSRYSALALQMSVIIFAGVFGGYKIDQWLDWRFPVFTVLLSLSSVTLAIYLAIRDFIKRK